MNKKYAIIAILSLFALIIMPRPALTRDVDDKFEAFNKRQDSLFNSFSDSMDKKYDEFVARQDSLYNAFVEKVDRLWNDKVYPTKKDYVEYKKDYSRRTHVDFEKGKVETSVLIEIDDAGTAKIEAAKEEVKIELTTTVSSAGKEELYVSHEADEPAPEESTPMLLNQVADRSGQEVKEENAAEFVEEVIEESPIVVDTIMSSDGKRRIKLTASYDLVPDHIKKRAKKYLDMALQYADKYRLDPRLVLAIMHTESYFNPRATSQIPAYGLMQIVPATAGRDAYKHVYGEDKLLSKAYLYEPVKNIELGCAYLNIVRYNYLKGIKDDQLAYPCAIASYNGGIGNLCQSLTGKKKLSGLPGAVNGSDFKSLVAKLNKKLPYKETRDYLNRVLERMPLYDEWVD